MQPVLFVSHGAPDLLLDPGKTVALWAQLGRTLVRPRAILAVSAHWEAALPTVSAAPHPATLHDFGGFPAELYALQYPAPGAPALAERVLSLLEKAGLPGERHAGRGLDHGAWVPLKTMYPQADVPVTQLAIRHPGGPAWQLRVGEALRPLREEGVLILASGSITHNFGWLSAPGSAPLRQAQEFAEWFGARVAADDRDALLDYRRRAPYGAAAHPRDEHLLPFFTALGAAAPGEAAQRFAPEYTPGGLAMDAYLWPGTPQTSQQ